MTLGFLRGSLPILIALMGSLFPSTLRFWDVVLPTPLQIGSEPLSCDQVWKLSDWGNNLNRFAGKDPFSNLATSTKILKRFLDKIDPLRVILTQEEESEFIKNGIKNWGNLKASHSCLYFDRWISISYNPILKRFHSKMLQAARLSNKKISVMRKSGELNAPEPYEHRPSSTSEIEMRIGQLRKKIVQQITLPILNAYSGNSERVIEDNIELWALDPNPNGHTLLAKSLLESIDPYSTYLPPGEFEEFIQELSGTVAGIGIRIIPVSKGLMIDSVLPNSPAAHSHKMNRGQVITKIGNKVLKGLPFIQQKQLLKGEVESRVILTLWQPPAREFTLELIRKEFHPSDSLVKWKLNAVNGSSTKYVAVLTIPNFYGVGQSAKLEGSVSNDVERSLEEIKKEIEKRSGEWISLLIDIRGNPGGYLDEAVSIAGLFLGNQPVVKVIEKSQSRVLYANRMNALYQGPMMVWVDEETASAAEVLSAALKDHQRALIVGASHTYGKGSVQKIFPLGVTSFDNNPLENFGSGAIKITTSTYYSPLGLSPNQRGLMPHIVLHQAKEKRSEVDRVVDEAPILEESQLQVLKKNEPVFQKQISSLFGRPEFSAKEELDKLDIEESYDTTLALAAEWAKVSKSSIERGQKPAE